MMVISYNYMLMNLPTRGKEASSQLTVVHNTYYPLRELSPSYSYCFPQATLSKLILSLFKNDIPE